LELSEIKRSGKSVGSVPGVWLVVKEKCSSNSYPLIQKDFMLGQFRDTLK
jgi:hypothetical protein